MICPHCHNTIPDGSNVCPLCFASLSGVTAQSSEGQAAKKASKPRSSRGRKSKRKDRAAMIIAIGLIVILLVIIIMIIRSMFSGATPGIVNTVSTPEPRETPLQNFTVFGATPVPAVNVTAAPAVNLEITPSPEPTSEPVAVTYTTLRKGDQGMDVMTLQRALTELGYLNSASDGIYGTGTMTAVKNFQSANGLDADGIAGRQTLEALYSQSSVTPIPQATVAPGDILDLPG